MAFCTECGAKVPDEIKFCTACGNSMGATNTAPTAEQAQTAEPVNPAATQTVTAPPPAVPAYQAQSAFQAAPADVPPLKNSKYAVMGVLAYIGTFILFMIPIVGLIFSIKWSFGKSVGKNRQNLARAWLILTVVGIIFSVVIWFAVSTLLDSLWEAIREATDGQFGNWGDIFDGLSGLPTN